MHCDNGRAPDVNRTVVAVGIVLGALIGAAPAAADPLNPSNPDYCGRNPNVFACTKNLSTYPNAGESAFLDATRGRVAGGDAAHLAAGRAVCIELPSRPTGSVVADVTAHLGASPQDAGQLVGAAMANICPGVQPQL